MALTGLWPCGQGIHNLSVQKRLKQLLYCVSPALGCPRVRRTPRGQTPVATYVAAPERPPGYVQRSRRRTNKQNTVAEDDFVRQDTPQQLQQASTAQPALHAADEVAAVGTVLQPTEQQQQLLQEWQQQQQLLQQQWQQQVMQEEALQQRRQLQHAMQQPSQQQQQWQWQHQHQQEQEADMHQQQQDSQMQQQPLQPHEVQQQQQQQQQQQEHLGTKSNAVQQQQQRLRQQRLLQKRSQQLMQQEQAQEHYQQQGQQQQQSQLQQRQQQQQPHLQQWLQQQQQEPQLQQWQQQRQQHRHQHLPQQQLHQHRKRQQLTDQQGLYSGVDGPPHVQQRSRQGNSSSSSRSSSERQHLQSTHWQAQQQQQQQLTHLRLQQQQDGQLPQQQQIHRHHQQQYHEHWQQPRHMHDAATAYSSSTNSSRMQTPAAAAVAAGGAYSIVPTPTAPTVAAVAARAAARTAARAAAASAAVTIGSSSSNVPLPPAEQCVPQQFWGLMREELRPWHKQVLVHLCYCLPPPACYIYRDMRAGTMQGVLAQRAMLEKAVRQCLLDFMWQQKRLRGWLDTVTRKDAGYVNPDNLHQAQKELLQLKATIGRSKKQLQQLQQRAQTYSDSDYCQYSSQFEPLLQQMDELCDTAREEQVGLILDIQGIAEDSSRRVLYARSAAAVAAIQQEAAAAIQQKVDQQQVIWKLVKQQVRGLYSTMRRQQGSEAQGTRQGQGLAVDEVIEWRYPPAQYILWRLKGRVGGSKPPLVLPGLRRKMPQARQHVEQV